MKGSALVGSLVIHAAIAGVLVLALSGTREPSGVVDVTIVELEPPAPPAHVAPPAIPLGPVLGAPGPKRQRAGLRSPPRRSAAPTTPTPALGVPEPDFDGDLAPGLPTGAADGAGDGDGNGDGSGNGGGGGDPATGTMPIPIGPRQAQLPYTRAAMEARIAGTVIVDLDIDAVGQVSAVRLVKGLGYGLDEIALRLAPALRFVPARDRNHHALAAHITWRFQFAPGGPRSPRKDSSR